MVYLLIPIIIFFTDLFLKNKIEREKKDGEEEEIFGGKIILHKYHNKGAMLNVMEKNQKLVLGISAGMTLALLAGLLCVLRKKGSMILKTAMSLVLGGALSNLYDRIRRKYVVDYFSFGIGWKRFRQIVFNISDICIFTGSFLFILWNFKNKS